MKSTENLKHFQKYMTIIANVFPKLATAKSVVIKGLRNPVSQHPSTVNRLRVPNTA